MTKYRFHRDTDHALSHQRTWLASLLADAEKTLSSEDFSIAADLYKVFGERSASNRTRKRAAVLLTRALEAMNHAQVIRALDRFRYSTRMEWFIDWQDKYPDRFLTPDMTPAERFWVLALAAHHPCGYLRERALNTLSREEDGRALGITLWGLCDWVEPVRIAAEAALCARLTRATPEELCGAIPFAVAVLRSERASGLVKASQTGFCAYRNALASHECRHVLTHSLANGDTHTRRFCIDLLAESEDGALVLLERLPHEPDPSVRRYLFKQSMAWFSTVACNASDSSALRIVTLMLADKCPKNRYEGLDWLYRHAPEQAHSSAMAALTDPNAAVRALAWDMLAALDPAFSAADYYREIMAATKDDSPFLPAALCGLGETGNAADCKAARPYLQHPRAAVVSAALFALTHLTPTDRISELSATVTTYLSDPRARVVKTAASILYRLGCPDGERVTDMMVTVPDELTRVRCLTVLSRAGKWQRLIAILTALTLHGERLERKAHVMLEQWLGSCNYSFASPTQKEAAEAERLITLDLHMGKLTEEQARHLLFCLP